MKGVNSVALIRLDYCGHEDRDFSTLLAIGTERTVLKWIAANVPGMRREGKFLFDANQERYSISVAPVFLVERMEADGGRLPYRF